jgi:hypothetical protein
MANSDKNIRITTSRNKTTFPNIVFTGSSAGSSIITLNILDDNTMSFESNEGQVFSLDSNLTTGTIWGVSDVSGIPLLRASAGATIGLAEYSGSLVGIGTNIPTYKLHVRGLTAFASTNDNTLSFIVDTSLAAGSANFQVRKGNSIRFYASSDSFYTAFVSSATVNTTYTLPASTPATGSSVLQSTSAGAMSWVPMTSTKRHQLITLAAGYTPATGTTADDAVYRLPFSPADGTTSLTYNIREAFIRTETPSAGISTVQIEYNTGTGVFDPPTGTIVAGLGLSVGGAGIAESISRNFNISQLSSGAKLRLRFGSLDSTHSDFLITLLLEEN